MDHVLDPGITKLLIDSLPKECSKKDCSEDENGSSLMLLTPLYELPGTFYLCFISFMCSRRKYQTVVGYLWLLFQERCYSLCQLSSFPLTFSQSWGQKETTHMIKETTKKHNQPNNKNLFVSAASWTPQQTDDRNLRNGTALFYLGAILCWRKGEMSQERTSWTEFMEVQLPTC